MYRGALPPLSFIYLQEAVLMTELLLRLFVKNYRRPEDPAVRGAIGKLGGIVGIIANGLLFL